MPYVEGDKFDLESRLHAFSQDLSDLLAFENEAEQYELAECVRERLNREFDKKELIYLLPANWRDQWVADLIHFWSMDSTPLLGMDGSSLVLMSS